MSKSIAVFGAGPGLGQAVARRYAREGYAVTLVGRRPEPLDLVAKELASAGTTAHVITADLSDTGATPRLAEQIRAKAGPLDAFYYAPTPETGFVSAANLTPQYAQNFMPLIFYTMLALVQEFLPHMLEQGDGAILTAQGGSTVQGLPNMSGPSPAQAAQSGRCLPSTPNISPACSGLCTTRRDSGKPSTRSFACRRSGRPLPNAAASATEAYTAWVASAGTPADRRLLATAVHAADDTLSSALARVQERWGNDPAQWLTFGMTLAMSQRILAEVGRPLDPAEREPA